MLTSISTRVGVNGGERCAGLWGKKSLFLLATRKGLGDGPYA